METSELFQTECEPTSSRRAHPVNRGLAPGSEWATRMTELSGLSLSRSLNGSSRITSCLKMLLGSSAWRSTACYLTWKRKATKQGRSYYQLAPSTPRTGEIGSGLWHTPRASEAEHPGRRSTLHGGQIGLAEQVNNSVIGMMFPTPSAQEPGWKHIEIEDKHGNPPEHWNQRFYDKKTGRVVQKGLTQIAMMFPTPRASANENRQSKPTPSQLAGKHGMNLATAVHLLPTPTAMTKTGGQAMCKWGGSGSREKLRKMVSPEELNGSLNPEWVSMIMGYEENWTNLEKQPEENEWIQIS